MPSNYTENYKLNQWEKTDQVLMEEFNADNLAIDEAIKAQADALAVEVSARETALKAEADARAQAVAAVSAALDKKGNYVRCERSYGSFSRSFDTQGIDTDAISASFNDGVLKLNLPKIVEAKPVSRKLEIQ